MRLLSRGQAVRHLSECVQKRDHFTGKMVICSLRLDFVDYIAVHKMSRKLVPETFGVFDVQGFLREFTMRMYAFTAAAIGALALSAPASAAVTISYQAGTSALPAYITGAKTFDFDGATTAGSGIFSGTNSGVYANSAEGLAARPTAVGANPAISTGSFGAVATDGKYTFTLSEASQVFSFVVGSLDTYNKITFFSGDTQVFTRSGAGIINGSVADGSQTESDVNGRVTYDFGGLLGGFDKVVFESSQNSFEFDNIATAAPEPATWGMMIVGFGLAGGALRSRRREDKLARA